MPASMKRWKTIWIALIVGGWPVPAGIGRAEGPTPDTPPVVAPGTREMADRLAELSRTADAWNNGFLNDRRVKLFRQSLALAEDGATIYRRRLNLALELLLSGATEEAIAELQRTERLAEERGWNLDPADFARWREQLAVSLLRLGEEENCCARHNIDSCFVPIRGSGIHTLERGSRGAITWFSRILESEPDDLAARWLLNIAHMTLGEYPDAVPAAWLIPESVFASDGELPRFYDVARPAGLDVIGLAGGSIMEDFDGDGLLDIMCSSWGLDDQLRYFGNNGDGTFTDRTAEAGLTGIVGGLNMNHADYDNDGYPDVLVLRGAWWFEQGRHPNSLLRNKGDGTFEDVTEAAGLLSFHPTQTAAWGDFDNDGWLDLFIGNETSRRGWHYCELYRNNADGTFTECASEVGVNHAGYVKGVAFGDYNNDGQLDLYLSVHAARNVLFRNDGPQPVDADDETPAWRFTDVTDEAGVAEPRGSFPTWFFDYDNDGWLDLLVFGYRWSSVGDVAADYLGLGHEGETPRLYHNNGDGTFTNVAAQAGLDRLVLAMGANFGDLDNDGYLDVCAGTGEPDYRALVPNLMFRNAGDGTFQDVTTVAGFGNVQKGHGIAFGDLDNDGDQDIYMVMGGAFTGDVYQNLLFENPGRPGTPESPNHWITLRLEGVRSNRAAIGARIHVQIATGNGLRDIHVVVSTGGSFGSSSLQQEIGLGDATAIRFVKVTWPTTGDTQVFEDVPMDRAFVIREGDTRLHGVALRTFELPDPAP